MRLDSRGQLAAGAGCPINLRERRAMSNQYDYRYADTPDDSRHSTPGWIVGLIAGAALGGGLALLFAPRQGVQTRHQLAERGQEAGRQLRSAYDSMAGTARRSARRLTEQAQDWRRQRTGTEGATSDEHGEAGAHRSSSPGQGLRGAIGEATYTPANVTPSASGPGATSPAPPESSSPF
jgi:gas vesicle protein